jgi:hypothetical protein
MSRSDGVDCSVRRRMSSRSSQASFPSSPSSSSVSRSHTPLGHSTDQSLPSRRSIRRQRRSLEGSWSSTPRSAHKPHGILHPRTPHWIRTLLHWTQAWTRRTVDRSRDRIDLDFALLHLRRHVSLLPSIPPRSITNASWVCRRLDWEGEAERVRIRMGMDKRDPEDER